MFGHEKQGWGGPPPTQPKASWFYLDGQIVAYTEPAGGQFNVMAAANTVVNPGKATALGQPVSSEAAAKEFIEKWVAEAHQKVKDAEKHRAKQAAASDPPKPPPDEPVDSDLPVKRNPFA